jgi:dimethylargininase
MWKAITRGVSPSLNQCELSYIDRVPIDVARAGLQHLAYENALRAMGAEVIALPASDKFPDCVFVEDPAIVLDEMAVLTRPGAASRRGERDAIAAALAPFREIQRIAAPATLEGGDVMRAGKTLYVGASARSNREGIAQLANLARPFGYSVEAVEVRGCLHLKSGCTYLGDGIVLANREWVDVNALAGMRIVDVAPGEEAAANVLTLEGAALMPDNFPKTARAVKRLGWKLHLVDISELQKAEAGVTCSSLIFRKEDC